MATVFRVHNPTTNVGLWYNSNGVRTNHILTLEEAKSRDLPMDFDPVVAKGFLSACDSLENMREWFYVSDIEHLLEEGYELTRFEVEQYQTHCGHAIFLPHHVIETAPLDIKILGV